MRHTKDKVIVRFKGGLGNQLFQYAAGKYLNEKLGLELFGDVSWYGSIPRGDTIRSYELHRLGVDLQRPNNGDALWAMLHRNRFLTRLGISWGFLERLDDSADLNTLVAVGKNRSIYLDGFWQKCQYTTEVDAALRTNIVRLGRCSPSAEKFRKMIQSTVSVSIHVRRGDYVSNASSYARHGVCGHRYYNEAIAKIKSLVLGGTFFLFTDDKAWAKTEILTRYDNMILVSGEVNDSIEEFQLMRCCQHQIIANSTFSWWSAWMAENNSKIVIAPQAWFADGRSTSGLVPEKWIRI